MISSKISFTNEVLRVLQCTRFFYLFHFEMSLVEILCFDSQRYKCSKFLKKIIKSKTRSNTKNSL